MKRSWHGVIPIIGSAAVLVVSAYLVYRFGLLPPDSPYQYLALLALVVTIIAVVAALFSIGGILIAERARDSARQIEREGKDVQESAKKAKKEIETAKEETTNHLVAIRNSAGAFQPSGHFLSGKIRALSDHPLLQASPEAKTFTSVLHELAKVFAENADFGAQIQKLFIGDRAEVEASAMFLSHQPSEYASRLLEERLSLEKKKTNPDVEIIEFISRML